MYIDGSFGEGGGIALPIAKRDGYTKFFAVITQERGFIKRQEIHSPVRDLLFRKHPATVQATLGRPSQYDKTREELLELERQGKACLFFPEHRIVGNLSRNAAKQQAAYDAGLAQAHQEVPRWKEFLGLA
jgi:predicted patatin/cPLA2 family phospholipase